jgi:hypothetical protein
VEQPLSQPSSLTLAAKQIPLLPQSSPSLSSTMRHKPARDAHAQFTSQKAPSTPGFAHLDPGSPGQLFTDTPIQGMHQSSPIREDDTPMAYNPPPEGIVRFETRKFASNLWSLHNTLSMTNLKNQS